MAGASDGEGVVECLAKVELAEEGSSSSVGILFPARLRCRSASLALRAIVMRWVPWCQELWSELSKGVVGALETSVYE